MQKEWKQKIPRKRFLHFCLWLQKRIVPKKFGWTKEQDLLESVKNYAKLKEYKFTPRWVRPKLLLLNVQYDLWIIHFTVTWKAMDTSTFTNWLNSLQHYFLEEIARQTWYQRMYRIATFCPFCTANHYENLENPSLKVETEFASWSMT